MASTRIAVPEKVKRGEVIELKALIRHHMETGYRRGARGEVIERDIIKHFRCTLDGATIFEAEFFPGVSANPLMTFYAKPEKSGTFLFEWEDQHGKIWQETADIKVV